MKHHRPIQIIKAPNSKQRFEGVAFSTSGKIMGSASSDTNIVYLFRRKTDNLFEDKPYQNIEGPESSLDYPHDLSFSKFGDTEILAVAQRRGSVALFLKNKNDDFFQNKPVFEISGPESGIKFSDGVAFVPPNDVYLAICNLTIGSISFHRKTDNIARFDLKPEFILEHNSICQPDGLAFSQTGEWLAVANHGNHTVSVFRRQKNRLTNSGFIYGPNPSSIIKDPSLCYPHSVAFSPLTNHLVVTNAGANYFSIYKPSRGIKWFGNKIWFGNKMKFTGKSILKIKFGDDDSFREINSCNKMEGGPKGIAIFNNDIAVCSQRFGISMYSFKENKDNQLIVG